MKRRIALLLALSFLLSLLTACRPSTDQPDAPPASEAVSVEPSQAVQVDVRGLANLIRVASGNGEVENLEGRYAGEDAEWMAAYIENAYGLQDPWEDAAVIRATGASAFEIAVLRMADEDAAARAAAAFRKGI